MKSCNEIRGIAKRDRCLWQTARQTSKKVHNMYIFFLTGSNWIRSPRIVFGQQRSLAFGWKFTFGATSKRARPAAISGVCAPTLEPGGMLSSASGFPGAPRIWALGICIIQMLSGEAPCGHQRAQVRHVMRKHTDGYILNCHFHWFSLWVTWHWLAGAAPDPPPPWDSEWI